MKLANTTGNYEKYLPDHIDRIKAVASTGFKYIDFSFYNEAKPDSVFLADGWQDYVKQMAECADSLGVKFVQSHAPGGNPMVRDGSYDLLLASTIRAIEVCGMLGIPNTVIHTGCAGMMSRDEYAERNTEFFKALFPYAEKHVVCLLCENTMHGNVGNNQFLFTGEDMVHFVEYISHPLVGCCWDTGHANCEPFNQYDQIVTMGKHLKAIHFNDNRGTQDEHIAPFCGTLCVDDVMQGLCDIGYDGCFTFECDSMLRPSHYWLGDRKAPRGNARLSEPTLAMQIKADELLCETGKYILSGYNLSEE